MQCIKLSAATAGTEPRTVTEKKLKVFQLVIEIFYIGKEREAIANRSVNNKFKVLPTTPPFSTTPQLQLKLLIISTS
jgi:hypothetical protein